MSKGVCIIMDWLKNNFLWILISIRIFLLLLLMDMLSKVSSNLNLMPLMIVILLIIAVLMPPSTLKITYIVLMYLLKRIINISKILEILIKVLLNLVYEL